MTTSRKILLVLGLLAIQALSSEGGLIVPYAMNSASGDSWIGYFEVSDMNVAVTNAANIVSFQGNGQTVLYFDNFSSNTENSTVAWYTFAPGFAQFSFQSPDFVSVLNGATWADINNTTFDIDSSVAANFLMQPGFSNLNGQNGSITFGSGPSPVPEPGTWAAAALLAGGATFICWRKRAKSSMNLSE